MRFSSSLGPVAILLTSGALLVAACGSEGSSFSDGDGGASSGGTSGSSGIGVGPGGGDGGPGSSGDASGPSCATAEATAAREPVYLHVVLDRSQSMDGNGNSGGGNVCDTREPVNGLGTCFLKDKREPDPLSPDRTLVVCHDRTKTNPAVDCPAFIGLTGKKWLAARGALTAYFDSAAAAADNRIGVGMFLFDGRTHDDAPWAVKPAAMSAEQTAALKATVLPPEFATEGGTPLRAALTSQTALIRAFTPELPLQPGGKRVLVLMTDGTPGDCGANRQNCVDDVVAMHLGDPAITTFVIGIGDVDDDEGSVYDEKFLSRLANAGGAAPVGCNPDWDGQNPNGTQACHFQVTPGEKTSDQIRDEMVAAFTQIAAKVQSCELTLNKTSPIDPSKVNVIYKDKNGQETQVPAGDNGWSYDNPQDPSKVILSGTSCDQLKADPDASVRIVIGCPTGTTVVH
jgi:hypothetical protein